jgi:hypothetical protein
MMGRPLIDISGKRFGMLRVLRYVRDSIWLCQCDCGRTHYALGGNVRAGRNQSCGCLKTTHGASCTKEYGAYRRAKGRCSDLNNPYYGGRGIEFRFSSFQDFFKELGPSPTSKHQIDRKNSDGHYEPGNVRWATSAEQIANRKDRGRLGNNQYKKRPLTLLLNVVK